MNIENLEANPVLFLAEPGFWIASILMILSIILVIQMFNMSSSLNLTKIQMNILRGVLMLIGVLTIVLCGVLGNKFGLEKNIRESLTEYYDLNEDTLLKNAKFTETEKLTEVAKASAVADGNVILSRYDKEAKTVTLYYFSESDSELKEAK